jgi:hypothetical protein
VSVSRQLGDFEHFLGHRVENAVELGAPKCKSSI